MTRPSMFITGGSRGIGREIVLAAAAAGWDVGFTYAERSASADETVALCADKSPGAKVLYWKLDVRDSVAVDAVADKAIAAFGGMRAVISNAAVNVTGLAMGMSDGDWSRVVDTNLSGSFFVARAFLQEFIVAKGGRFVFLGSVVSGGASGQIAYSASKSGLLGLSSTLAKEYGRKRITSNVIEPGYFPTDMTRETMADSLKDYALAVGPSGRGGRMDELTALVLLLISDGGGYINGQSIRITGGLDWSP